MPTKRIRGKIVEFIFKKKSLLGRPVSVTFPLSKINEASSWAEKIEAQMALGIVPPELQQIMDEGKVRFGLVGDVIRAFLETQHVPDSDRACLNVIYARIGTTRIRAVNYAWIEKWIVDMKRELTLAPSTIRHHVGALGRCFDWGSKQGIAELVINPIRILPRRYATYTEADLRYLEMMGKREDADHENERDRRLHGDEEEQAIRAVLIDRQKPANRERPLELEHQPAMILLFELALETGMRMREMFSLSVEQVSLEKRTVFLDKTKNGDKRQVPLSSIAIAAIQRYVERVRAGDPEMQGWRFEGGWLFPWWDGSKEGLRKTTALLSRRFSRVFDHAGCPDLHFHDLRHEATSRLYERTTLTDVQIASITGHKDLRMLKRYANLRGSNLAAQLW